MKGSRIVAIVAAAVVCLCASGRAVSQSSNATLSGTVSDAASALIPGVTVTAANTGTALLPELGEFWPPRPGPWR